MGKKTSAEHKRSSGPGRSAQRRGSETVAATVSGETSESRNQTRTRLDGLDTLRKLIRELQHGNYPNKERLARLIGRDKRTVQRLLQKLKIEHKAPIDFNFSENGFYLTDPHWKFDGLRLDSEELVSFFNKVRMLNRGNIQPRSQAGLNRVRQSLAHQATYLPDEVVVNLEGQGLDGSGLDGLGPPIDIAPEPALKSQPGMLIQLTEAALRRETIFIRYFSQRLNKEVERHVNVLLVHNYHGEWYAVAWDDVEGRVRDFHAGRILSLRATQQQFTVPAGWDARAYLNRGFGMFRGGRDVTVIVEFDAYQARYVRERRYHVTQRNEELPDERLRVSFETTEAALPQVVRWLMQFGEHALAIAPLELVVMMREILKRALNLYEESK